MSEGNAAVSFDLASGVNLDFSSWATRFCNSSIGVLVPAISARLLRRDSESQDWIAGIELTTGATIDKYTAEKGWRSAVANQQAFIREQDAETKRIAYLYDPTKLAPSAGQFFHDVHIPTPRPCSVAGDSSDSSNEDHESDGDLQAPASSASSSSSETAEPLRSRSFRGRKQRYFRRRPARGSGSLSEEGSVSDSTHSSIPSCDRAHEGSQDPSDYLAAKIRQLRSMKEPLIDFGSLPEPSHRDSSTSIQVAEHRGGTIINVSILPIALAVDPSASLPISELISAGITTGFRDKVSSNYHDSQLTPERPT